MGFAKLTGAASPELVATLSRCARRLAAAHAAGAEPWSGADRWLADAAWRPAYFAADGDHATLYDCLGLDAELDAAVDAWLATPTIRGLLDAVVGPDRRIWFVQFRWARPGGDEYVLHQDVYGELALCLYLNEHQGRDGSMVFWPRSHRMPRLAEALPLLHPGPVLSRLGHVDGAPGDACVFLNKTWHGRTAPRRDERLVFLISFIPPGPIVKGRRVPEHVRARLGPELRRVTAPEAGRSFGARHPAAPPPSSAFEEPAFDDDASVALAGEAATAHAWAWCRAQAADETDDHALWLYKRVVRRLPLHPDVPVALHDLMLDDLGAKAAARALGDRARRFLRMEQAVWNGDARLAGRELAAWQALERDWLCDSEPEELVGVARLHAELGEPSDALGLLLPLLADDAGAVPPDACSLCLEPLLATGRAREAAELHARGLAAVAGDPEQAAALGRHLTYLAWTDAREDALALLRDCLPRALAHRRTGDLWELWLGAWILFARMRTSGAGPVELIDPVEAEEGVFEPVLLADRFRALAASLAGRLDRRNGNGHRARMLANVEGRLP